MIERLRVSTRTALALTCFITACGCTTAAREPLVQPSAFDPDPLAAILVGTWTTADGHERWVEVGDRLVGVGFAGAGGATVAFEVMLVHPGAAGPLLTAMPGGLTQVDFAITLEGASLRASNASHDDPKLIVYRRADARLHVELDGEAGLRSFEFVRTTDDAPVPELEQLDLAFAADSAARGGAAWAERFTAAGATWPIGSPRSEGPEQIAAGIDELRRAGRELLWTPLVSGLAPAGDVGFTVGSYELRSRESGELLRSGVYVTIWRRSETGWAIVFDSGVASGQS